MKLVNPVGRDLTELETEAYSCHCICSSGEANAQYSGRHEVYETCECDSWNHELNLEDVNSYEVGRNN
ncbi:CA_C0660 family putative sactipeptide bacteriocin [Clostridium felsineum]|uniref:CA_C0660 family putative sactipeptide bacteriocin n=1 Tax=Clostridium felsineum TaxID=36839 RepID=UPI00098C8CBE|nr:CA_C0660 family putative sactipeptide bacteriocin [Clostridium felsineum]URZ17661.1 hypothetical protein CLFE_037150 [Clostridium felsineum DSM 794]